MNNLREYKREWARNNREKLRDAAKRFYKNNKEKVKQYHQDHKEQYLANRKKRLENCPHRKNQTHYYGLIRRMINTYKKGRTLKHSTLEDVLGISKVEFMAHLESTLPKGKTIAKDYGRDKYEVDHIIPCSQFDLGKESDLKMCFNWRNMRLIKRKDNLARNRRCDVEIEREGYSDNRKILRAGTTKPASETTPNVETGDK